MCEIEKSDISFQSMCKLPFIIFFDGRTFEVAGREEFLVQH